MKVENFRCTLDSFCVIDRHLSHLIADKGGIGAFFGPLLDLVFVGIDDRVALLIQQQQIIARNDYERER